MTGEALAILANLVAFPTESHRSNLDMVRWVQAYLGRYGIDADLTFDTSGTKANLYATIGPRDRGGIVLSAHSDVVPASEGPWTTNPFAMRRDGSKLFGRGTTDMKGFLACVLAAVPHFARDNLHTPVHIALSYDEEIGCLGVGGLLETLGRRHPKPLMAIVGEPTSMECVTCHKGCSIFRTEFHGFAAHTSKPSVGRNALEGAARFVNALSELADELATLRSRVAGLDPSWTTLAVTAIQGGVASNVVPDRASVEWNLRTIPEADQDTVFDRINLAAEQIGVLLTSDTKAGKVDTSLVAGVPALLTPEKSEARSLVLSICDSKVAVTAPFATEASLFQAAGIDAVVCGPGLIEQAHTVDEFLEVGEVARCASFLERLLYKVSA